MTTAKKRTTTEPGPREQRRQKQLDLARNQLLDAAEAIFGRRGYHDASIKEIAELAEFSVGSVYTFFENKDDLFRQLFVRRGVEFMPLVREVLGADRSAVETLHALLDFEIGYFRTRPEFGRLYLRYSNTRMEPAEAFADAVIMENLREAMALQAKLFSRGQAAGEMIDGDPEMLARFFSSIVATFQASDRAVMDDDARTPGAMTDEELHAFVERTFCVSPYGGRSSRR